MILFVLLFQVMALWNTLNQSLYIESHVKTLLVRYPNKVIKTRKIVPFVLASRFPL